MSKEEGARQLLQSTGEDFRQFLGDNPLRDAYVLKIKPEYTDTMHLRQLERSVATQRGVFEVQYPQDLFTSINNNLTRVSLVLLGFAAVLVLVVVILINNTIKLALFSQRFLIRSMQLVGATPLFIQQPFLRRATWQGLASGVLAALLLVALLQYAYLEVEPAAPAARRLPPGFAAACAWWAWAWSSAFSARPAPCTNTSTCRSTTCINYMAEQLSVSSEQCLVQFCFANAHYSR